MGIRKFYDKEVIVYRLRDISGGRSAVSSTATVDCHIQKPTPAVRQTLGILEEEALIAYFDEDADVNEGDILEDGTGAQYRVNEVTTKDYGFAINRHKMVILLEYNA